MQLVAPDVLADACGLSAALCITGVVLGLALWLLGWWCHRFWIVLFTTVLAGIYGLYEAAAFKAQPIVAAVLLAIAAGLLALALVRLLAFIAGGLGGLLLVTSFAPNFEQPLLCFVVSGLLSLLLFRLALMALTSLAGSIVMAYSILCLLNNYGVVEAVGYAERSSTLLNSLVGLGAFLGFAVQFLMHRRRRRYEEHEESDSWDFLLGRGVRWGFGRSYRKAG
jgi:hypothetical protein